MKLLNRLRELRDEHYPVAFDEVGLHYLDNHHTVYDQANDDDFDHEHLDTIGVGATTVDDIIRLNLEHGNLQDQTSRTHFAY